MMMKTVAVFSMIISVIFSCDKSVMTDDLRGVELSKSKEEEIVRISQMYRVERARWSAGRELMNSEIVRLKDELQHKTAELDAGRSNVEQAMRFLITLLSIQVSKYPSIRLSKYLSIRVSEYLSIQVSIREIRR